MSKVKEKKKIDHNRTRGARAHTRNLSPDPNTWAPGLSNKKNNKLEDENGSCEANGFTMGHN